MRREQRDLRAASVYESAGGYCSTIGIIGAVLGLIQVIGNLTEPELLGAGIATAFVATIYGVGMANLVLLPIAHRLKAIIADFTNWRELVVAGVVSIAQGENPRFIEARLESVAD